jgi:hypothetical protein
VRLPNGEAIDVYGIRSAWLAALSKLAEADRPSLSFARLMALTTARDDTGTALRRWLDGGRWPGNLSPITDLGKQYG